MSKETRCVCRSSSAYLCKKFKKRQKGVCVPLSSFGVYSSGCYPGDCAAVQQQHVPRRSLL